MMRARGDAAAGMGLELLDRGPQLPNVGPARMLRLVLDDVVQPRLDPAETVVQPLDRRLQGADLASRPFDRSILDQRF